MSVTELPVPLTVLCESREVSRLSDAVPRCVNLNFEANNIATTYKYDIDAACNLSSLGMSSTSSGDLISMTDAIGNKTCYTYDSLHRVRELLSHS